jgi:hypothetical protein
MKRFPTPWLCEERDGYFVVRDSKGRTIAHIDFAGDNEASNPGELCRDEALSIASGIARLPNLIQFQA